MKVLGPFCPVDKARVFTNYKVNEILFKNLKPEIVSGPSGKRSAYTTWKKQYKRSGDMKDWNKIAMQSQMIIDDVEICIKANPDYFVGIVGYNTDNILDTFQLLYSPPASEPVSTIPLVDPSELTNDVH